jgi:hypothetical protein
MNHEGYNVSQWLARPPGIELNLRKSIRRAIVFYVPALALAARFD